MEKFTPKHLLDKGFSWNGSEYVKAKEQPKTIENRPIKAEVLDDGYTTISLVLMGVPMAKQSVRATKSGHFFQPKEKVERFKDYQNQIIKQLPIVFKPFEKEVLITKMHFIYPPLKAFQKQKGVMEKIHNGEMIPKTTKPDWDNIVKLTQDSLSGLVFKDDALIYAVDGVRKYYGTGGCVIIELKGK